MKREMLILTGLLVLACGYGFWGLGYAPLAKKLQARRLVLAVQEKKLLAANQLVARYDEYREQAIKLQMQAQRLQTRIPPQPQMPSLLKDITRVASECNIREFEFTPLPPVSQKEYKELPVRISLCGSYHALGAFLTKLALLPRLVVARDVKVSGKDKTGKSKSISADLVLVTYVFGKP